MKILVVGGGGREHALVWRLSEDGHEVICAPGNPGMAGQARCVALGVDELERIVELAVAEQVALVVVGPEAPLVAGLADRLRARGVPTFGPGADGARLEGSKVMAKEFFARHGIPSAPFVVASDVAAADAGIEQLCAGGGNVVVKADGLAAGKGVVVASTVAEAKAAAREMLEAKRFRAAGATVVIERKIGGREVSVLALTDGTRLEVLPPIEDHKTIGDGDTGPNTGGMGTVSPAWVPDSVAQRIRTEILEPTVRGLRADGIDYRGVLFAGVMVEPSGAPWLLEYNCRFGDPETQPTLARMRGDFAGVLAGAAAGQLPLGVLAWDLRVAVCVVVAAAGYPGTPRTGDPISGLDEVGPDAIAFHAGTTRRDGQLVTAGGRVLGVTALGIGVQQARTRAYEAIERIELPGKQFRTDIGARKG